MNPITILMQADPATSRLPYLAAILMVMIALVFLWGVRALTLKRTEISQPIPVALPAAPAVEEQLAPEIIAVIAAAVATTIGPAHRVVSIRRQSNLWEKVGRQSVLTSHRIR